MAGWCNSSSRWVQSLSWEQMYDCVVCEEMHHWVYKMHRVVYKCGICICSFRQLFMLLRTRQISWRTSPRVGKSRKRNAWKKSENSSSTSPPPLMLFMRCTIRWMLISITQCDCRTFLFPPAIHLVYKVIYTLQSPALRSTSWGHLTALCGSVFIILCCYTSNVCALWIICVPIIIST